MERDRPDTTLGAFLLAVILVAIALLPSLVAAPVERLEELPTSAPAGVDPRTAAAFGWPISPSESDPRVWEELDRVGPVLAGRLARAAEAGLLARPAGLLQVEGIGATMAARLGPQIGWKEDQ